MTSANNWSPWRDVDRIILHHSASPRMTTDAEDVRKWHIEDRGWDDVGYHFLIERGRLRLGRQLWRIGSHDGGENSTSIGVCLMGNYTPGNDKPGEWAFNQLVTLLGDLLDWFDLPTSALVGHGEHEPASTPTECPGLNMTSVRMAVRVHREGRRERGPGLYKSEKT